MNRDKAIMQPILGKAVFIPNAGLTLGNLIFMMRENEVTAAAMEVKLLTEVFQRHRRTLDMPAWTAFAPGAVPARFTRLGCLPKGKVHRMFLALIHINAGTSLHILKLAAAQLAISGKFLHAVEHIPIIHSISIALVHELLHHGDNIGNGFADARINIGAFDIERIHSLEIGINVAAGNVAPLYAFFIGGADNLVIHIREILDITHLVTLMCQIPADYIPGHKRTGIADMRMVVRRNAAAVDAGLPLF